MDFISNQEEQIKAMLADIGVGRVEDLFAAIPKHLHLGRPVYDDGLSEAEGKRLIEGLAAKNTFVDRDNYLGAGAYEHYVPAIIASICQKAEFLTGYTPYQAEASQGMLQAIFEFQSAICALTGMDVANASVYDGAAACAEAVLMAMRHQPDRKKILIAGSLHPHYNAVVKQYLNTHDVVINSIPFLEDGSLDIADFQKHIDDNTTAVLLQYPNFFGLIDPIKDIVVKAREMGALTIVSANPLVYGLYASAAEMGVDIAVGDCQPLGLPLQFGGPYVGYMTCRKELVRQLPGRIVGETVDGKGRKGFALTLQAREQHIRREKATSNICTNQALAALACLIAIVWYGKEGIPKLALTNYQRAAYLKDHLSALPGIQMMGRAPFFNEFAVHYGISADRVQNKFRENGIEPGLDLGRYFPSLQGTFLIAVTEMKTKLQLDRYLSIAAKLVKRE